MQAISYEALPLPATPKGVTTYISNELAFINDKRAKAKNSVISYIRVARVEHGGTCMMMHNNNDHDLVITEPDYLQSRHEEADTLVAFHANQAHEGSILIGSTDTDVLVILIGLAGRSRRCNSILDYGSGNHRRYIAVSNIAAILRGGYLETS